MRAVTTEIFGSVPERASLILPSRIDLTTMAELCRVLGGEDKVAWMAESGMMPTADIRHYLEQKRPAGFCASVEAVGAASFAKYIRKFLDEGRHVVFLNPAIGGGSELLNMPPTFHRMVDEIGISAVPVGVSMFNPSVENAWVVGGAYEHLQLHFMPIQPAGESLGMRVCGAWVEAETQALSVHPLVDKGSVALALFEALRKHSRVQIFDGADDTRMSYGRILAYSLLLSKSLRRFYKTRNLGVILPPGKLSLIANIACLFAGICPVNINYEWSAADFEQLRELTGLERFMTTRRFMDFCSYFPWPPTRDMLFIDEELLSFGRGAVRMREFLTRRFGAKYTISRYRIPGANPEQVVMRAAVRMPNGRMQLAEYTNKAILSSVVQQQSYLRLQPDETALFAMPLCYPEALAAQFLIPVLNGMPLVTYPAVSSGRRVNSLILNHAVRHLVLTPEHAQKLFSTADAMQYRGVRHFLLLGGVASPSLVHEALSQFNLTVEDALTLPEFLSPFCFKMHTVAAEDFDSATSVPSHELVGRISFLPGFSVRLMDLVQQHLQLSSDARGIVCLVSPSVVRSLLSEADAASGAYTTHAFGGLLSSGELEILGRKEAFSRVQGKLVVHAEAEAAILQAIGESPSAEPRRIALIGMPGADDGGHTLYLLSTITYRTPNMYDYRNARMRSEWIPRLTVNMKQLPLAADGSILYDVCRSIIVRHLSSVSR